MLDDQANVVPDSIHLVLARNALEHLAAELAERSGLSRATIVSLESGRAGAQYATIRKIANVQVGSPMQ